MLCALAAVHLSLCALPVDVTEHASDSSLAMVVQRRIGRSSQAQLERAEMAAWEGSASNLLRCIPWVGP